MFIFIFRATFTVQLWPNRLRPQTCSALLQYTLIFFLFIFEDLYYLEILAVKGLISLTEHLS